MLSGFVVWAWDKIQPHFELKSSSAPAISPTNILLIHSIMS
jgi:hypothetical protein